MAAIFQKTDIKELDREQLVSWLKTHRIRSFRASQILKWVHIRQADTFEEMTDLKKEVRHLTAQYFTIDRLELQATERSNDGCRKYLFALKDGQLIESVLIPERKHFTLCISSQVGCAQGCTFCMTGKSGWHRNLTSGEIIAQVRDTVHYHRQQHPITNIVFMGMGEPLANYEQVIRAIALITDNAHGLGFAKRRVTLSTVGLVPGIVRLGQDSSINLAISLNATDDATRSRLMPVNNTYSIAQLLSACRQFPLPRGRKITVEYILIDGVNDSLQEARRLAALLRPINAKINLIPFNEHSGCHYRRSSPQTIQAFQNELLKRHYTVIIRQSKGADILAACGQLRVRRGDKGCWRVCDQSC